jgi:hypothetical protein
MVNPRQRLDLLAEFFAKPLVLAACIDKDLDDYWLGMQLLVTLPAYPALVGTGMSA